MTSRSNQSSGYFALISQKRCRFINKPLQKCSHSVHKKIAKAYANYRKFLVTFHCGNLPTHYFFNNVCARNVVAMECVTIVTWRIKVSGPLVNCTGTNDCWRSSFTYDSISQEGLKLLSIVSIITETIDVGTLKKRLKQLSTKWVLIPCRRVLYW